MERNLKEFQNLEYQNEDLKMYFNSIQFVKNISLDISSTKVLRFQYVELFSRTVEPIDDIDFHENTVSYFKTSS